MLGVLSNHITNHLKRLVAGLIGVPLPGGHDRDAAHVRFGTREDAIRRQKPVFDQLARGRDIHHRVKVLRQPLRERRRGQTNDNGFLGFNPLLVAQVQNMRFINHVNLRFRPAPARQGLHRTHLHRLMRHPARMTGLNHAVTQAIAIEGFAGLVNQRKAVNHEIRPVALCHHHFHQSRRQHGLTRSGRRVHQHRLGAVAQVLSHCLKGGNLIVAKFDLHHATSCRAASFLTVGTSWRGSARPSALQHSRT